MKKNNHNGSEEFLRDFSRKAPPPGLKQKVLERVIREKKAGKIMTPFLQRLLIYCTAFLLVIVVGDLVVSNSQFNRIFEIMGIQPTQEIQKADDSLIYLAELLNESPDSLKIIRGRKKTVLRSKMKRSKLLTFEQLMEEIDEN